MPRFTIREHVDTTIEAPTAQDALDLFLNDADNLKDATIAVNERWVLDEAGDTCEVRE